MMTSTVVLLQKKSESKQLMETKQHRQERKKLRRPATKLSSKKTPKFWMGRKVRWRRRMCCRKWLN